METSSDPDKNTSSTAPAGPIARPRKTPSANKNPPTTDKLTDNDHGNRFQAKLLLFFFIRAINMNYNFHLGTELEKMGGKFDDLIFLKDYGQSKQSFLYLQAKHKQDERKNNIKANDLLSKNDDNFSLTKYFHSYRDYVMKTEEGHPQLGDKVDCVICTNIDFDKEDLANNGIQLVTLGVNEMNDLPREMLTFKPIERSVTVTDDEGKKKNKKNDQQKYYEVANFLLQCATNPNYDPSKYPVYIQSYKALCETLGPDEKIIDSNSKEGEKMKFHQHFIVDVNISNEAKELRKAIVKKVKDDSWKEWKFPFNPIDFCRKIPMCLRLKITRHRLDMHYVANVLRDCAENPEKKLLDQQDEMFKCYHSALISGKVIDLNTKTFHQDFIDDKDLSDGAKRLRNIIDEMDKVAGDIWKKWKFTFNDAKSFENPITPIAQKHFDDKEATEEIEDFFNKKLIFAVNTPNEEELDTSLKDEVGDYLNMHDTDLQSTYILKEMINWFKSGKNVWLSAKEGKNILEKAKEKIDLFRATSVSIYYQEQLKVLEFNDTVVDGMVFKLEKLLASQDKIVRISTSSPKLTAVKVIAAFRTERLKEYNREDSYLVVPLIRLQNVKEKEKMEKFLNATENSHRLLVIVCDESASISHDEFASLETLISDDKEERGGEKKKGIVIGGNAGLVDDAINFSDLTDESQTKLLDRRVSFQGKDLLVRDLVPSPEEEISINSSSISELLSKEENICIPSCDTDASRFNNLLYIPRCMVFPQVDDTFWKKLISTFNELRRKKEEPEITLDRLKQLCEIDSSNGHINWLTQDENDRKSIWKAITLILKENNCTEVIQEAQLINERVWERRAVIISGEAGSGKSSLLSRYYQEIKKTELGKEEWIIRINLMDYSDALLKFDSTCTGTTAVDFFVNLPAVVDQNSSFSQWLLRRRFEMGDRIVLM